MNNIDQEAEREGRAIRYLPNSNKGRVCLPDCAYRVSVRKPANKPAKQPKPTKNVTNVFKIT